MRRELMDILVCPVCKGTLELNIVLEEDDDVVEGDLEIGRAHV